MSIQRVISKTARLEAIAVLGDAVDKLHARARNTSFAPSKEALREAADLIADKRKELQRETDVEELDVLAQVYAEALRIVTGGDRELGLDLLRQAEENLGVKLPVMSCSINRKEVA